MESPSELRAHLSTLSRDDLESLLEEMIEHLDAEFGLYGCDSDGAYRAWKCVSGLAELLPTSEEDPAEDEEEE